MLGRDKTIGSRQNEYLQMLSNSRLLSQKAAKHLESRAIISFDCRQ
jgi:hypothetical protein